MNSIRTSYKSDICSIRELKARQNVRFVTFYQKKFGCSSKEAYYYGEKSSVLADIFTFADLKYFKKNLLLRHFDDVIEIKT